MSTPFAPFLIQCVYAYAHAGKYACVRIHACIIVSSSIFSTLFEIPLNVEACTALEPKLICISLSLYRASAQFVQTRNFEICLQVRMKVMNAWIKSELNQIHLKDSGRWRNALSAFCLFRHCSAKLWSEVAACGKFVVFGVFSLFLFKFKQFVVDVFHALHHRPMPGTFSSFPPSALTFLLHGALGTCEFIIKCRRACFYAVYPGLYGCVLHWGANVFFVLLFV